MPELEELRAGLTIKAIVLSAKQKQIKRQIAQVAPQEKVSAFRISIVVLPNTAIQPNRVLAAQDRKEVILYLPIRIISHL